MSSKNEIIEKKFEREIWLFLDNDLPQERMEYWQKVIEQNPSIQKMLSEAEYILNGYDKSTFPNLDDSSFEKMIETATKSRLSFVDKLLSWFSNNNSTKISTYKLAFGATLIIIAVAISLLDNKPNPINKIGDEFLQWDDTQISEGITKIENTLFDRDEKYKEYIKYQISTDPWKRNISTIEKRINKIKNEIAQSSL